MAKAGMKGNPPVVNIAPAPSDAKRQGEFHINDIRNTIERLNSQMAKAAKVGIAVEVTAGTGDDGVARVAFVSASRA